MPKDDGLDSDAKLIDLAREGDEQSYANLLLRYQDRLFRSITAVVGCPTTAEDIVQEAFVRAFLNLKQFKRESNFYTWLYRIAMNARRPYFRKVGPTVSIDTAGEKMISDKKDSPATRAERTEQCQQVRLAMDRLESHHRTILVLREFDGFDYEAIARILQINKGTVRSRLSRARERLRGELKRYVASTPKVDTEGRHRRSTPKVDTEGRRRRSAPPRPGLTIGLLDWSNRTLGRSVGTSCGEIFSVDARLRFDLVLFTGVEVHRVIHGCVHRRRIAVRRVA